MPSITISESNSTVALASAGNFDVVFVPGLAKKGNAGDLQLFDSLKKFREAIGSEPVTFVNSKENAVGISYPEGFPAANYSTSVIFKNGEFDPGYIYASELLSAGIPVVYGTLAVFTSSVGEEPAQGDPQGIEKIYTQLSTFFTDDESALFDKGEYDIKYVTSGGYPVFDYSSNSILTKMVQLCSDRGDCFALIDYPRALDDDVKTKVYEKLTFNSNNYSYAAMFAPWYNYNLTSVTSDNLTALPASFAYLKALTNSLETNAPWLAVAGVSRGKVNGMVSAYTKSITNGLADDMQPRSGHCSMNSITSIRPYGEVIWGNRTLYSAGDNLDAYSFLNTRNLICDVKKLCWRTARKLTFEQDNDVLWVNFKANLAPTLDRMVSGYGISGYKIVKDDTHESADQLATLCVKIHLYPVYAVEDFYISIVIDKAEAEVSID